MNEGPASATTSSNHSPFLKNTFSVIAANVFGGGALLLANVGLARFFSVEDYGSYKIITYFFVFLFGITDLGINITLIKHISQFRAEGAADKVNHLLRALLKVKLFSHSAFLLLAILAARPISFLLFHNGDHGGLVILGTTIIVFSLFETPKIISLGFQRYREFSLSTFLTFLFSGVFTLAGGYWFGVSGAVVGFAAGFLIGNIPSTLFVLRHKIIQRNAVRFDTRPILLRYSLPIFLTVIPNSLGNAYIPLLSPFFSRTLIGYYGFAFTFYSGIYLLIQSLYQLMITRSAGVQTKQRTGMHTSLLRRTFIFYAGLSLVSIVGILLLSRPIIGLINPTYAGGLDIFRGFLSAAFALGFLVVLSGYWSGVGKIKKALGALVVYNILLFTVSYILLSASA